VRIFYNPLFVLGLAAAMLLFLEAGRRIGVRREQEEGSAFRTLDGALFGLMGLLFAFSFSGAAARFEAKRQLIVDETNAIETAYLRIDILPSTRQEPLRGSFRRYLDARLAVYSKVLDTNAAEAEARRATALQHEIWSQAVAACREAPSSSTPSLVMSSLNAMIDISTTRDVAREYHPPTMVFLLLGLLLLICSLLAGFGTAASGGRSLVHMLGFAAVLAITVYVILDYEYPRMGLIRLDTTDRTLVELRQRMN